MKRIITAFLLLTVATAALAQSSPGLYQGFIPTAAQWNSYFAAKQDYVPNAPISGIYQISAAVNFNASGDTTLPISLPIGNTRYLIASVAISGASASLTTATAGLFTAASGGGVAIVTGASTITVSTASDATANNAQLMTVNGLATTSYGIFNQPRLYFRVATPQGSAATATVTVRIVSIP